MKIETELMRGAGPVAVLIGAGMVGLRRRRQEG